MNGKQTLLLAVLVMFGTASAYVALGFGLEGMWVLMTDNGVVRLLVADLAIALTLVSAWMWNDARDRGISPIPYVVLTLLTGSVGPLLYLIRRERVTPLDRATVAAPIR